MNHTPATTFPAYCTWARTKEKPGLPRNLRIDHGVIGLVGEIGEFLDAIKKNFIYEQPLNQKLIREELGDALFYLTLLVDCDTSGEEITPVLIYESVDTLAFAMDVIDHCDIARIRLRASMAAHSSLRHILGCLQWLAHEYNLTLVECMQANQEKLEIRYKDGYSNEAAAARADKAEERGHAS